MRFDENITKAKHSLDFAAGDLFDAAERSQGAERILAANLYTRTMELLSDVADFEAAITEDSDASAARPA